MKDIPVFSTENGVASLTLREIPYTAKAYIKIRSSLEPEALLEECIGFCKACGAESIFACGEGLEEYPVSASLIRMKGQEFSQTDAALFPATEKTIGQWRQIYCERMAHVPNAACFSKADESQLLRDGDCYFIHRKGELLGIGKASAGAIHAIASVKQGSGGDIVLALASAMGEDSIAVIVARENERAMKLYEKLGFIAVEEVSLWHKII